MIYADTSILAKPYYQEPDSEAAKLILSRSVPLATASLTYAEFFSGLHRKLRLNDIDRDQYQKAAEEFAADWKQIQVIPLSREVLHRSRRLIERHGLRTGDAVQLASALTLSAAAVIDFASADRRLAQAAEREGLAIVSRA